MLGWIFFWLLGGPVPADPADAVLVAISVHSEVELPRRPDGLGIASRFGDPGDKHLGGTLKCRPKERVSLTEHQCAHRYYECGTILIIENQRNGKRTWCEVMDRGPYGAAVFSKDDQGEYSRQVYTKEGKKAWYVKRRRNHRPPDRLCPSGDCVGRWRGILDMSPAVSDDIDHNGFERVKIFRASRVADKINRQRSRDLQVFFDSGYSLESRLASR